jgi:hypothetical protein
MHSEIIVAQQTINSISKQLSELTSIMNTQIITEQDRLFDNPKSIILSK